MSLRDPWNVRAEGAAQKEYNDYLAEKEGRERNLRISKMLYVKKHLTGCGLSDLAEKLEDDAFLPIGVDGLIYFDLDRECVLLAAKPSTPNQKSNIHHSISHWVKVTSLADIGRVLRPSCNPEDLENFPPKSAPSELDEEADYAGTELTSE